MKNPEDSKPRSSSLPETKAALIAKIENERQLYAATKKSFNESPYIDKKFDLFESMVDSIEKQNKQLMQLQINLQSQLQANSASTGRRLSFGDKQPRRESISTNQVTELSNVSRQLRDLAQESLNIKSQMFDFINKLPPEQMKAHSEKLTNLLKEEYFKLGTKLENIAHENTNDEVKAAKIKNLKGEFEAVDQLRKNITQSKSINANDSNFIRQTAESIRKDYFSAPQAPSPQAPKFK